MMQLLFIQFNNTSNATENDITSEKIDMNWSQ